MGSRRPKTKGLAEKLRDIRMALGLSQVQMVDKLKKAELPTPLKLYAGNISRFEQGGREPPPLILLAYARSAKVAVEILIDANQNLPRRLLPAVRHRGNVVEKRGSRVRR
ncbi:MAG: hypothetical protein QOH71_1727 [Blastocatellia bacterium]|jgi:transcriptional regulator with XRE-family HTH domain|nr:hypothetical protein [Blastocatellia bacterium]